MRITCRAGFSLILSMGRGRHRLAMQKGTRMIKPLLAVAAALSLATTAQAANFSFTGTLDTPSTVQFFDFNVGAASDVTLRTWSYAGGVNAAGTVISRGGFDPILALFSLPDGALVGQNDDGIGVPIDPLSNRAWDTLLNVSLEAGTYRVAVMVFPNFAFGPNLSDGFEGATDFNDAAGIPGGPRTNQWAFDILNVNDAVVVPGVPEPASWALLIAGFGLTGAAMRRRRVMPAITA